MRANTDSLPTLAWHGSLDPGPRGRIDCLQLRSMLVVGVRAVTSPVSSMPWSLATEATPRQLRGRSCAEITRHAAGRDAHTAHTQSSLPAGQGHEKPPFLDGAGCNYMDMVSLLSQHSIPLCGGS